MLKIRRPLGRLIFNMGIAIPGQTVFLIETAPRAHQQFDLLRQAGNLAWPQGWKLYIIVREKSYKRFENIKISHKIYKKRNKNYIVFYHYLHQQMYTLAIYLAFCFHFRPFDILQLYRKRSAVMACAKSWPCLIILVHVKGICKIWFMSF